MSVYQLTEPVAPKVPILVSSPHSGLQLPDSLKHRLLPEAVASLDDADWFIDRLYGFVPELGITLISANYHRWLVDLNRDPDSEPLYTDGRVITGLMPSSDFNGNSLYKAGEEPKDEERTERVHNYYKPYHNKIEELLKGMVEEFGVALLFDAHSIRRVVPGIRAEAFPALILGDNDGKSAAPGIIDAAMKALATSELELSHNHPFKGGCITRSFGQPDKKIHALQLEMIKTNYMDDMERHYDEERAAATQRFLKNTFQALIEQLQP